MSWFGKSKKTQGEETVATDSRIEVVAHKDANKEVVEQAKKANEQLKNLLDANGFTIKIYLAAGGNPPRRHAGNHTK